MEMEEQYGITDLTHYMSGGRPVFTAVSPTNHLLSAVGSHHHAAQQHHYDQMVMSAAAAAAGGGGGMLYRGGGGGSDHSTNNTAANSTTAGGGCGLEMEIGGGGGGGDGGNGRWPRQETLTLLEVRSRLDSKFKEANQKGPLWDEVSRIMCEEHGYQRSGKKCREKFENLYKYYKKTKEGKAGRQDGKHYRFFRQLEALYGETSSGNNISASFPDAGAHSNLVIGTSSFQVPPQPSNYRLHDQIPFQAPPRLCCDSLSLSTSSPLDSSSSDSMENHMRTKRGNHKRSWKVKIKEFIDSQMTRLMEKQEEWLQKMMKTIEHKEQERILREEEWRREEAARIDREHKFWANERAWMEARDAAFMEALHRLTESKGDVTSPDHHDPWEETEITRLMHLRRGMEASFRQGGCPEEVLWEEVAAKMACLGYDRNGSMCKAKWDRVNSHLAKSKKQKETSRSSNHLYANINHDPRLVADCEEDDRRHHHHHGASSPLTTSTPPCHVNENGYRFLIGEPENMWESYGMKLTKQGGGS